MKKNLTVAGMVALAVGLLAPGVGAATSVSVTTPAEGATISRSANPSLAVTGLSEFDQPQQADSLLYMRRTLCASGDDDSNLSTVKPNASHQSGCGFIAQPANEVLITTGDPGLSTNYPSEDFAFTLDASKPITGTIRLNGGVGQATTELTLTGQTSSGQEVLLGTASETYTVTGAVKNMAWSIQPAATEDKKDFSSIKLNIRVRGVNVLHGGVDHRNGVSTLTVPVWTASFGQKVQFAIDSPSFSGGATKTATLSADGLSWTGSTLTPAVGNHKLYVRAVQGSTTTTTTPVSFTVTA